MTPAGYVEKIPTYTAARWDGSEESAAWIMGVYGARATRQGEDILIEGPVHTDTLPQGMWVAIDDRVPAVPAVLTDEEFTRIYQAR